MAAEGVEAGAAALDDVGDHRAHFRLVELALNVRQSEARELLAGIAEGFASAVVELDELQCFRIDQGNGFIRLLDDRNVDLLSAARAFQCVRARDRGRDAGSDRIDEPALFRKKRAFVLHGHRRVVGDFDPAFAECLHVYRCAQGGGHRASAGAPMHPSCPTDAGRGDVRVHPARR